MSLKNAYFDRGSRGYYKPFATRTIALVSLLLITLTLIALTEYACHIIPAHAGIGAIGNALNSTFKRDLAAENVKGSPVQLIERLETYSPILSFYPLSLYLTPLSSSSISTSSSSPLVTSTATGGYLSLGGEGGGGSITTSVAHGGWLSTGDGSTTDPDPPFTPVSQPTTVDSPASNPDSQPTPSPVVGGNDPPVESTTAWGAAPSNMPVNPVQQPTGVVTPNNGGPTGTISPSDATETVASGDNAPPAATVAVIGGTSFAASLTDSLTDPNLAPTLVVVLSNGQTSIDTPNSSPVDPSAIMTPVVIVSNDQTFVGTPSPDLVIVTSNGKIFTETPSLVSTLDVFTSDGRTFTQSPDASPTPIVVVSDGKTFTETPVLPATAQDASLTPVVLVSDGQTFTSTPSPHGQVDNPSVTPIIVVSDGHTYTETPSYIPSGAVSTASEIAIKPVATIVNSTGTFLLWPDGDSSIYPQITLSQYILVAFVPLILAVLYTIPFRVLDRTIREFEPFYQLSRPGGALAEHSLCLDYMTSNVLITPFKAGLRGHGYMLCSSMLSLAVTGIAPLSSEALFVSLSGGPDLYGTDIGHHYQDYGSWGIYPALARSIEGLLAFVAVLIAFMIWHGLSRKTRVYAEPLSIAGLATLFHSSPLLRVFRTIDSQVNNSELKQILAGQRYKIGDFMTADYRPCHGLLPADSESGFILNAHRSKKGPYRLVEAESGSSIASSKRKQISQIWEIFREKLLYIGILILNTGMLTLISYYHWSEGDIYHGFEQFMDSSNFGVRFMMTALGVILKMFWSNLDQELRRGAPYQRMAHSSVSPLGSILVPNYMSPFSAIIPSLRLRHFLTAHIAFLSILSELLPICLANITYSAATTQPAYEACNDISLTILLLMLISILILILRPRKKVKLLPRDPNTVASILVYLAGQGGLREREGLLDSVKGMERMETNERNEVIADWNREYSLGLDKRDELRVDEAGRIERLWVE